MLQMSHHRTSLKEKQELKSWDLGHRQEKEQASLSSLGWGLEVTNKERGSFPDNVMPGTD